MVFLLDRNTFLRAFARNIVSEYIPQFDFRSFYLKNLEQNTISAILGLGETGSKADALVIAQYLNEQRPSIVQSALISLMRLDAQKYEDDVANKLMDNRVSVVKTAQQLILKYNIHNYGSIGEIFQSTPYEHTKIKCLAILFSAPKWDRLIYMLEALSCEMKSVRELALQLMHRWLFRLNRSYVPIQQQQKEHIILLLQKDEEILPKQLRKEILFAIGT